MAFGYLLDGDIVTACRYGNAIEAQRASATKLDGYSDRTTAAQIPGGVRRMSETISHGRHPGRRDPPGMGCAAGRVAMGGRTPDRAGAPNVYETQFTVGNGRFAARGSLQERHHGDIPGARAAGVYDAHDSIVIDLVCTLPDWLDTAVIAAGTQLTVDSCTVVSHQRALDLAHGVLWRLTVFEDRAGNQMWLTVCAQRA